jgi:hypothetical protein
MQLFWQILKFQVRSCHIILLFNMKKCFFKTRVCVVLVLFYRGVLDCHRIPLSVSLFILPLWHISMDIIHCDHFISLLTMIFHLRACGLVSSGEDDKRQAMLTNYNKILLKLLGQSRLNSAANISLSNPPSDIRRTGYRRSIVSVLSPQITFYRNNVTCWTVYEVTYTSEHRIILSKHNATNVEFNWQFTFSGPISGY